MSEAEASGSMGRDEQIPLQQVGPGAQLAAYREERGWTIEQVASQLNLAPRQVVALEHDDHASLPGMPIVRGFIRAYAKLLKVDPAPLLAPLGPDNMHVQQSIEPRHSLSMPFAEARLPSMTGRAGLPLRWLVGALLVLLLGVGIWAAQQYDGLAGLSQSVSRLWDGVAHFSKSENEAPAVSVRTPVPAPAKASDAPGVSSSEPQVSAAEPAQAPVTEQAAPSSIAPESMAAPAAPPAPPSAPPVAAVASSEAQAQSAAPATPSGKDALIFNARKDSWIEVRRASNNSVLLSQLVKAGSTETVEVSEPVTVVVGNAAGVDATLRGAALDLKAGTGNVARLTVK